MVIIMTMASGIFLVEEYVQKQISDKDYNYKQRKNAMRDRLYLYILPNLISV